jgi:hypothetical protein
MIHAHNPYRDLISGLYCTSTSGDEIEDQGDYRQNQQNMDKSAQGIRRNHAEKPQDKQNDEDSPQHPQHLPMSIASLAFEVAGANRVDTVITKSIGGIVSHVFSTMCFLRAS